MIRATVAALLALLLLAPAEAANDRYPRTTVLGKIVAQVDSEAALGGVQIFLRGGLDRQTSQQNGYAALLAELVARTPVEAGGAQIALRDAIANLGANLTVTVEPQDVRYYVEGRPPALAAALALLGAALSSPDFSHLTLDAAKTALRARIDDADQSPFGVVTSMLRGAYYLGSGAGYTPTGTQAVVANASSDGLRAFWAANYRRGGVGLAAAGRVDDAIAAAAQAAVDRLPAGNVAALNLKMKTPTDPPARIVTHRDVGLPWIGVGFRAPSAGAKDFATMLVIQAVIASLGRENAITTRPPALRPINAVYQYDVRPANFIVYASGDVLSTNSGIREIFAVAQLLSTKSLDASTVERYRALTIGQFVTDNVTVEDRAALVGLFARQGLDPDYLNRLLAAIETVTPADVRRVAKAYLGRYTVALILPRAERPAR
jgi:predicted Zn-dependent peptidase